MSSCMATASEIAANRSEKLLLSASTRMMWQSGQIDDTMSMSSDSSTSHPLLPAAAGITGHSYLEPAQFAIGFRTSIDVAAACCALGGLLAAVGISNAAATGTRPPRAHVGEHAFHCGLDATPLATAHAFEP